MKRIEELKALAKREADAWKDVDRLIQRSQAKAYDQAVELLLKLQDLAAYQDQKPAFGARLNQIHDQYSKRSAFIKRLHTVGLHQQ